MLRGPLSALRTGLCDLWCSGPAFTHAPPSRDALWSLYTRGPAGALPLGTDAIPRVVGVLCDQAVVPWRLCDLNNPHARSRRLRSVGPSHVCGVSRAWRTPQRVPRAASGSRARDRAGGLTPGAEDHGRRSAAGRPITERAAAQRGAGTRRARQPPLSRQARSTRPEPTTGRRRHGRTAPRGPLRCGSPPRRAGT